MRLAWASVGTVSDAMARAITEAVARNEVFTEFFPIMVVMYTVGAGGPAPVGAPHAARMRGGLRACVSHGGSGERRGGEGGRTRWSSDPLRKKKSRDDE